jgi:photosystem II stability/assembly factor-like uncharacterized protein
VLVGLDDGSVWQSTDQAAHFGAPTTLSNDSPVLAIVFATKTSALLALTGSGNVFKTSDGGATFFAANLGLDGIAVNAFAVDPSSPDNVYAGTAHGFYETTRGGE